jgi:ABC-2 type transport system permease protein
MTTLNVDQFSLDFSAMEPNFTVINRDIDSPLAKGLVAYLSEHGNEVIIDDDKTALQDASFFLATDYIIFLPQGFRDSFFSDEPLSLEIVKTTETAIGFYADSLVNQYLNQVRFHTTAIGGGIDEQTIISAVQRDLSMQASIEKIHFGISAPLDERFTIYNQMASYALLVLSVLCVTNITMVFRRSDLRLRNLCSPLRPRAISLQLMLCSALFCIFAWILVSTLGFVMFGSNLGDVDNRVLALIVLNSFVFTFVAMSVAALSGSFVRSINSQNAAANMMTLGLCFLGGVFVPLSMLGDNVIMVSRFLPTYWYVTGLETISKMTSFDSEALRPIWQAMLIQLTFAAAISCVTLTISKQQSQSEKNIGSTKTELEA